MKIAFLIFILVGITFLGCSDNFENTLVSSPVNTDQVNKSQLFEPQLDISDPATTPLISASKLINGETGGELIIDTTYVNYQGRLLYVYAEITVQQFSFQGTTEFTMILHPELGSIELFPHMDFDRVVRVWVWFEGIDLEALGHKRTGHVDFVFFADDGNIELIPAKQSHVNMAQQTIKVMNAQLQHFSRYGWVR